MVPLRYSLALLAMVLAGPVRAQADTPASEAPARPITLDGRYVLDLVGVAAGGDRRGVQGAGNFELTADVALERLFGWRGATVQIHLLSDHGRAPNDLAGTLQGIDNIEVEEGRTKLYEAWIEQHFAGDRAALLLGLADLNVDFYQNDSAAMLMAPAFGVGSELAATGPNGPSIFPSTALMARLKLAIGASGYARAAVVNARAGVLGDEAGVDWSMQDGALLIAEAGTTHGGKLAAGVWRYTRRQDDIRALDPAGNPVRRIATGGYILIDQRVSGDDRRGIDAFLRAGLSEGNTTPFHGGFQLGVLLRGFVAGRPDGWLALGVAQGWLSSGFRDNLRDAGERPGGAETGFEISYQDRIASFLTVQPDLQYIHRASDNGGRDTLVLGMRLIATFGTH